MEFRRVLFRSLGNVFPAFAHPRPRFIAAVLRKNRHWCDDVGTPSAENCPDRLSLALKRALDSIAAVQGTDIAAWRWRHAHRAIFRHRLYTHVPLFDPHPYIPHVLRVGNEIASKER